MTVIPARLVTLAAILASLAFPLAASAQQPPAAVPPGTVAPHRGHHGSRYFHALRTLNLSPAQQQQIAAARAQTRQANQNADKATRHANGRTLRAQIDGILNADQRARLHAALQRTRAARPPV